MHKLLRVSGWPLHCDQQNYNIMLSNIILVALFFLIKAKVKVEDQ
jgi:hypothetical protein